MSDYRNGSLAPLVLVCAFFVFVIPNIAHAQTGECGRISISDFGIFQPIEDCDNPFNADESIPYQYHATINGQEVIDGAVITLPAAGESVPLNVSVDEEVLIVGAVVFAHEDGDYVEVGHTNEVGNGSISVTEAGEYSFVLAVAEKSGPIQVSWRSLLKKIVNFFVPTALAFFPDDIDVVHLTFTVEFEDASSPTSVLFLPGIKASRLYTTRAITTEDQLWEPTINQDVAQLEMTEGGESVNEICTNDVIDEVFSFKNIYLGLLEYANEQIGINNISDWKAFAYDWRYSVSDVVENGTQYENERIYPVDLVEELAGENGGKVTIVAHSNGGLLAKALMQKLEAEGKTDLVERIVLLASPQIGTPKSIGSMLHGYDEERVWGLVIDDETAREVIRNMPGAYGLIPSRAYFNSVSEPVVSFSDRGALNQFTDAYGDTVNSISELTDFMNGEEGRRDAREIEEPSKSNGAMLEDALAYHHNFLDDWEAPDGVEVIEIVGTGIDTINGFRYEEFTERVCFLGIFGCRTETYTRPMPTFTKDGDGTVVAASAEAYGGAKTTYYIDLGGDGDDVEHADITESSITQDLLTAILTGESVDVPHVSTSYSGSGASTRDMISVHSPVSIRVVDSEGNEVRVENDRLINEIPGSTYMEFAGGKYVIVPADTEYEVQMEGEATGSYTVRIDTLEGDESEQIFVHTGTTNRRMEITFEKNDEGFTPLAIDENGDGRTDEVLQIEKQAPELSKYTYDDLEDAIENLDLRRGERIALLARVRLAERMHEHGDHWLFSRIEEETLENIENTLERLKRKRHLTDEELLEVSVIIDSLKD